MRSVSTLGNACTLVLILVLMQENACACIINDFFDFLRKLNLSESWVDECSLVKEKVASESRNQ